MAAPVAGKKRAGGSRRRNAEIIQWNNSTGLKYALLLRRPGACALLLYAALYRAPLDLIWQLFISMDSEKKSIIFQRVSGFPSAFCGPTESVAVVSLPIMPPSCSHCIYLFFFRKMP